MSSADQTQFAAVIVIALASYDLLEIRISGLQIQSYSVNLAARTGHHLKYSSYWKLIAAPGIELLVVTPLQ